MCKLKIKVSLINNKVRILFFTVSPCISIHYIQHVLGGKNNILGGHSIGHSKQKTLYEHVSYSEGFPR
jgi:hypothetical protein